MTYWTHSGYHYKLIGERTNLTKYHDSKHFSSFKNDVAIVGEEQVQEIENKNGKEFICEFCRCVLTKLVDASGENVSYYCNRCSMTTYDTNELRSQSYLEMSDGPVEEPSISYAPEKKIERKKKEIKGGLAELEKRGVHVTSYKEGKG
jgi:hypothetical protein